MTTKEHYLTKEINNMRPENNPNAAKPSKLKDQFLTRTSQNSGTDYSGQKFYCTHYSKVVEREDCLNCVKWDDCPEREAGSMAVIAVAFIFGLALAVAFIIGQLF